MPLMAWVIGSAAAHPEGVGVQLLADALRLERIFARYSGSSTPQRAAHQLIVGEDRAPAGDAFVGEDGDQRVDAVVRLDLVRPAAFRRAVAQAGRADFRDSQCATPTRV